MGDFKSLICVSEIVDASPSKVWRTATERTGLMFMGADVRTDWKEGHPISFKGEWKGKPFEDKGEVETFEPERKLAFTHFSPIHSVSILVLMFLSMSWNFGFLLMAIDRLRNEVADLALLDDLTGVGNRRHLLQRLTEECARSERSGEAFALLVIDLDGFKAINDTHGHAAGDACLQHFTLMAQTRLRPGDMLARTGGDEFCIVLPASTLREGAMIARRILDVCREDAEACVGNDIPISLSIGVAQWSREMGAFPDRVIAAADHALYAAKKDGRNRHAVYDPAPPLAPGYETLVEQALRKRA